MLFRKTIRKIAREEAIKVADEVFVSMLEVATLKGLVDKFEEKEKGNKKAAKKPAHKQNKKPVRKTAKKVNNEAN